MRKKEAFSCYDAADYLKSKDDMAAYLAAVIEDAGDDAACVASALGAVARAYGMDQLATDARISPAELCDELSPGGDPSLATVLKIMSALGLKLTTEAQTAV